MLDRCATVVSAIGAAGFRSETSSPAALPAMTADRALLRHGVADRPMGRGDLVTAVSVWSRHIRAGVFGFIGGAGMRGERLLEGTRYPRVVKRLWRTSSAMQEVRLARLVSRSIDPLGFPVPRRPARLAVQIDVQERLVQGAAASFDAERMTGGDR